MQTTKIAFTLKLGPGRYETVKREWTGRGNVAAALDLAKAVALARGAQLCCDARGDVITFTTH